MCSHYLCKLLVTYANFCRIEDVYYFLIYLRIAHLLISWCIRLLFHIFLSWVLAGSTARSLYVYELPIYNYHSILLFLKIAFFIFWWMQYEDAVRQEAARKSVPVDELEEKALVSLAKVHVLPFTIRYHSYCYMDIFSKLVYQIKPMTNLCQVRPTQLWCWRAPLWRIACNFQLLWTVGLWTILNRRELMPDFALSNSCYLGLL